MTLEAFAGSAGPTLGVELELQLVNARTLALVPLAGEVLDAIPAPWRGSVKPEFHPCCIEVNTGVCRDVDEVGRDLGPKLAALAGVAARFGARLAWGGTHPFSHWRDQPITPDPRYRELAELYQETLQRQLTFGLHVHVGVPDGDAAVRACNGLAAYLPALLALSANSAFWCGRPTGLLSHRTEVLGSSPIGGPPPRVDDWAGYERLIRRLADAGCIRSTKDLWWDARVSERHGTVEVRVCDMPPDLPSVLGLVALIQCLVCEPAPSDVGPTAADDECGRLMARQNRWRAARFGLAAELADPATGRSAPAREVLRTLADRLRGTARSLDCERHLDYARAMAEAPTGADRQLAAFRRTGDVTSVAALMVAGPGYGAGAA